MIKSLCFGYDDDDDAATPFSHIGGFPGILAELLCWTCLTEVLNTKSGYVGGYNREHEQKE